MYMYIYIYIPKNIAYTQMKVHKYTYIYIYILFIYVCKVYIYIYISYTLYIYVRPTPCHSKPPKRPAPELTTVPNPWNIYEKFPSAIRTDTKLISELQSSRTSIPFGRGCV